jgi:hypothetical protein
MYGRPRFAMTDESSGGPWSHASPATYWTAPRRLGIANQHIDLPRHPCQLLNDPVPLLTHANQSLRRLGVADPSFRRIGRNRVPRYLLISRPAKLQGEAAIAILRDGAGRSSRAQGPSNDQPKSRTHKGADRGPLSRATGNHLLILSFIGFDLKRHQGVDCCYAGIGLLFR